VVNLLNIQIIYKEYQHRSLTRKISIGWGFIFYLPNDVNDGAVNPGEDTDDGVIKLAYEPDGDGAG